MAAIGLIQMKSDMQNMNHQITILQASIADLQFENFNLRQGHTDVDQNIVSLRVQCRTAHTDHGTRIGSLEASGPAALAATQPGSFERGWTLESKGGQLKILTGEDKAKLCPWALGEEAQSVLQFQVRWISQNPENGRDAPQAA